MSETVLVSKSNGGYDDDGNYVDADDAVEIATIAVAPGNTTLSAVNGGETDVAAFTVYLELGSPIADDDEIVVRGHTCTARVKEWISPRTGRGGLEVLCTSVTGSSGA